MLSIESEGIPDSVALCGQCAMAVADWFGRTGGARGVHDRGKVRWEEIWKSEVARLTAGEKICGARNPPEAESVSARSEAESPSGHHRARGAKDVFDGCSTKSFSQSSRAERAVGDNEDSSSSPDAEGSLK